MTCGGHFDIEGKKEELKSLEDLSMKNDFWDDVDNANNINKKMGHLIKEIEEIEDYKKQLIDLSEMLGIIDDQTMLQEITLDLNKILDLINKYSFKSLLNKKYDINNCILEIHPGAGGTEACDWAGMLFEMYERYCNLKGYEFIVLDIQKGDEAGIKSATIRIVGPYAYGYLKGERGVHRLVYLEGDEAGIKSVTILISGLNAFGYAKCERGIHRLVRISPFDSNSRRHTSFASINLTPEIEKDNSIEINANDLKIDVYHSSGAGGQSVNTTDSAVRITHLPTKIVVSCQKERSQIKNKEIAMNILMSKLVQLKEEKEKEEMSKIKGQTLNIDFGSQIRSYTLEPYKLIKDTRFDFETSNVEDFLNGYIDDVLETYLKSSLNN